MSGNKLVADTNIILYLLNGDHTVKEILQGKDVYISFITEIELYSFKKLDPDEKAKIDEILSSLSVIDINNNIKANTIEIRRKYPIKTPDSLIAATAIQLKAPLFSGDKDFKKIDSLNLISYKN